MKVKLKKYAEENMSKINIRRSQRADEDRSIADRIAAEQRDAERRKRDFVEEEKAISFAKRRFKQETKQVLLGEREEVSSELTAAQLTGYRNLVPKHKAGTSSLHGMSQGPRVRPPTGGYKKEDVRLDRALDLKRQAAGGGVKKGSAISQEKHWQLAVATLFVPGSNVLRNRNVVQ
mmetsp:Transcript_10682/g.15590  ORF Transcript_10682/g.15590 Transcript_10682/m.15590 type:complete len:176 (+) Transcript_10682:304-831(+)